MPDDRMDARIGLNVIAAGIGVVAVATGRLIHQKSPLTPWLLLGLVPRARGRLVATRVPALTCPPGQALWTLASGSVRITTRLQGGYAMRSTMQDFQLTIGSIREHGTTVHRDSRGGDRDRRRIPLHVVRRARRAGRPARERRCVRSASPATSGWRTFQWNNAEHLAAYLAVPSMGAVLHTLNIRLFPEQLVYIANHAEDQVVIVDDSLVPLLAQQLGKLETVKHVLVAGPDAAAADLDSLRASGKEVTLYDDLLADQSDEFDWPEVDERDAAAMCYTSGTTGNPKGVVYSHRSAWLHSQAVCTGAVAGLDFHDRVLPIVPMFHANAWGLAYAALMSGASLCMPDRWLQAEPLVRFVQETRPTLSGAVPTVWNDVLSYLDSHDDVTLDSIRLILCGGSAVPVALQKALEDRHGLRDPAGLGHDRDLAGRDGSRRPARRRGRGRVEVPRRPGPAALRASRAAPAATTVEVQPRDGLAVGEVEVRGPVGHRRLLQRRRPGRRQVPRRLAAHRRRRHPRRRSATSS